MIAAPQGQMYLGYRIDGKLAGGGMGRVFEAVEVESGKRIALKLVDIGTDEESREIVAAERRGATLQSRLSGLDSRVTAIHTFGEHDGYFYIAMEFIDGDDLSEVLAKGPIGVPFAMRIATDICEVLAHAHTFRSSDPGEEFHGIVHGDIKPRNIRITKTGQVKVLDFGIAKALSLTRKVTRNQFGSLQYSSRERLLSGDVDADSDLWSVAVVLYEMLRGKPYFAVESGGAPLEQAIRQYRQVRDMNPGWPAGLRAVLARALHPDRGRRYPSAGVFAADLKAVREGRTPSAELDTTAQIDTEATRRSSSPSPKAGALELPAAKQKRSVSFRWKQIQIAVAGALTFLVVYAFYNEYRVFQGGQQLQSELDSERLRDLEAAWQRYDKLARASAVPLFLFPARNALGRRLQMSADQVIREYRDSESPAVGEGDWQRAQTALTRALQLDTGDRTVRGKLRVCEGHLDRIQAPRLAGRAQSRAWSQARMKFEEASELMSRSPDPYLGLARLYVYGLNDVDRARDALQAAERRGFRSGRREKAQVADGYRSRGDRMLREARRATAAGQEEEFLRRAEDDYARAEEMYQDIVPFARSTASLQLVLQSRDRIDLRLRELRDNP